MCPGAPSGAARNRERRARKPGARRERPRNTPGTLPERDRNSTRSNRTAPRPPLRRGPGPAGIRKLSPRSPKGRGALVSAYYP
ncbi:hypothetical protein EF908_14190 [Streptomyces sp. WAC04770]|nr:hypothetical protein EF908_14190 [Streptomyces sp. WAC04770]